MDLKQLLEQLLPYQENLLAWKCMTSRFVRENMMFNFNIGVAL